MKKTLLLTSLAVLAIACTKESAGPLEGGNTVFEARFGDAPEVKTTLSGSKVLWEADDEILLLWEGDNTTANATSSGETTTFPATVGVADTYYAVYPSSVPVSLAAGALTMTVPATQHGAFADANIAVARTTDKSLIFKNLCALGKFYITRSDIAEVRFAGNADEVICGEGTVTLDETGIPACSGASGKEIVLTPSSGNAFAPGAYYFAVLPGTLSGGVRFTLKTSGDVTLPEKSSTNSAVFERSKVLNFKFLDIESSENPYGNAELEKITATTAWEGSKFDAIISANSTTTDWTSPDGQNFISDKLGYLAGFTTSVDEVTGQPKVTYGKFKFKKDEKAYNSGTKMSRVQLGGTGVLGSRNLLQFKVAGPGTVTLIGRSSGDVARKINIAIGNTPLSETGFEMPGKAADALTLTQALQTVDGDIISIWSMESSINLYSIKWTPEGGGTEPDPDPAEGAELECTTPPTVGTVDPTALAGYGAAVTGGDAATGSNILHFNNGKALQTWLLARTKSEKNGDHSPVTIWLSGTFGPDCGRDFSEAHPWFDVKDVSNLSFYGTDSFVMDRIGIFCVRASNIIIRNINFQQPKANNGADAISMQECDGVWVDHCTFTSLNQTKDYEDGSTDITHASKNVTVSWCRYIKTQKSCLVGHSNSASADAAITATFHHNWFDGSSSRHPRVRFGRVHVYNNLFDGCTTYGVGSAYGAKVLVEYNYFDGVQLPTDICTYPAKDGGVSNLQGSVAGYLYPTQNVYVNRPTNAKDPYPLSNVKYTAYNGSTITPLTYDDFKPAYTYTVSAAEDVPELVKGGAGYGKLTGFAEAPVAVNNGGITEFDGTPDDPTDPDPDEPENPDTPATGLAEGWNWVCNNGATANYSLATDGQLTLSSNGKWESGAQTFGAVYRSVTGNFTATVKLVSSTPTKDSNQGVSGIIAAEDLSATANNLVFILGGKSLTNYYSRIRLATGEKGSSASLSAPSATGGDVILKLQREGNKIKASYSLDGGTTFGSVSSKEFTTLAETLHIGVACNSADSSKQGTAVFSDFKINDTTISF